MRIIISIVSLLMILGAFLTSSFAATGQVNLSAIVLSKSQCKFNTKNATIDFGLLDPGDPIDASGSASFDFTCVGNAPIATYVISIDDGLYSATPGTPRMQHATDTTAFMSYSLNINPTFGSLPKKTVETLQVDAFLPGSSYAASPAGIFTDTVTLTLLP